MDSGMSIKLHPIVVFSILDHHIRRQEGQDRVIGTLLGAAGDKTVDVSNAFAVPHTERADSNGESEVAVGQAFNKTMYGLLSRVNKREKIVGWYATSNGTPITDSSSLIHEFYLNECENAIHIVVDTSLGQGGIDIKAFASVYYSLNGEEVARAFAPVKVDLHFSDAERLCIDRMIKGQKDPFAAPQSLASLPTEMANVQASMDRLVSLIDTTLAYVEDVKAGKRAADPRAARHIADAIASLPKLSPEVREAAFASNMNDVAMVSYLCSLTQTQLAIAAKIHETF